MMRCRPPAPASRRFPAAGAFSAGLVATWCLFAGTAGQAAVRHVAPPPLGDDAHPGTEAQPFATIRRGFEACAGGDTVLVADGTYAGEGNRDLDFQGKAITVRAKGVDAAACVIDAGGSLADPHVGFRFTGGETALSRLEGLTVTGGHPAAITINYPTITAPSTPSLRDLILAGNPGAGLKARAPYSSDRLVLLRVSALDNGAEGLWLEGCNADLEDGMVSGNNGTGVYFGGAAEGVITDTQVQGNGGHGVEIALTGAGPQLLLRGCGIRDNLGWGLLKSSHEDNVSLAGCKLTGNGLGGLRTTGTADDLKLARSDFLDNHGPGLDLSGAMVYTTAIDSCLVTGNEGDGIRATFTGLLQQSTRLVPVARSIANCVITDNTGAGIRVGGGFTTRLTLARGIVARNLGDGLVLDGEKYTSSGALRVDAMTITGNGGRGVVHASADLPCEVRHTIIAGNGGQALEPSPTALLTVTNCDFTGNTGGDWTGDFADDLGVAGNVSLDPLFCSPCRGDYHLAANSPCDAANNPTGIRMGALPAACGNLPPATTLRIDVQPDAAGAAWDLVGPDCFEHHGSGDEILTGVPTGQYTLAWQPAGFWLAPAPATVAFSVAEGVEKVVTGAYGAAPVILAVADVAHDQGRQVRVTWRRSVHDAEAGDPPVNAYGVYRRQDDAAKLGGWDFLVTVPARGDSLYQVVAPTLTDSTEAGPGWSVFMVSALTPLPLVFFDSLPDSGWSVDNIAPAAPTGLRREAGTRLAWEPAPEADFQHHTVYGAAVALLDGSQEVIARTTAASIDVSGLTYAHFLVTTSDSQGNESAAATLDATSEAPTPEHPALLLLACRPNPFNPSTTIGFELPAPAQARLAVYDLTGRLVRTLVDGSLPRGRHEATWDGRDAAGRSVASGLYIARLEAGGSVRLQRMGLVR